MNPAQCGVLVLYAETCYVCNMNEARFDTLRERAQQRALAAYEAWEAENDIAFSAKEEKIQTMAGEAWAALSPYTVEEAIAWKRYEDGHPLARRVAHVLVFCLAYPLASWLMGWGAQDMPPDWPGQATRKKYQRRYKWNRYRAAVREFLSACWDAPNRARCEWELMGIEEHMAEAENLQEQASECARRDTVGTLSDIDADWPANEWWGGWYAD